MKRIISIVLASVAPLAAAATSFDLKDQVESYELRYRLRDPYTELVNYEGTGFDALYGVRNFRVVLNGVYYRGGANNTHNKYHVRGNDNPLEKEALVNLCREGFSEAVYLYATNFHSEPKTVSCKLKGGEPNALVYKQINGLIGSNEHEQLQQIYEHIEGVKPGPIYDHCWNGWHASGYVAAISLMQFCGYSNRKADAYWVKDVDGNVRGNSSIRRKIARFKPFSDLRISSRERDLICPK